jgi:hypothetical protein
MGRYRATSEKAAAVYEEGEFDRPDWTVEQENDALASGLVEIVPRTYRVATDTRVNGQGFGETFEAAYRLEQEKHLVDGGFITPVDDEAPATKTADAAEADEPKKATRKTTKGGED